MWSAAIAAASYVNELTGGALGRVMNGIATTAANALSSIGLVLATFLADLLTYVLSLLKALLTAAWGALWKTISGALSGFTSKGTSDTRSVVSAALAGQAPSMLDGIDYADSSAFLIVGTALTVLLAVALGVTTPVSIGLGTVVGVLVAVMLSALGLASPNNGGSGFLGALSGFLSSAASFTGTVLSSAVEAIFNYTSQSLLGLSYFASSVQLTDPTAFDWFGYITQAASFVALGVGGVLSS